MITNLFLRNFKGFGSSGQNIPMNRITLLFGANSSGKTSIIQSLLLLNQTITEGTDPSTILLPNGTLISLGNFREFVHKHETDRVIQIGLKTKPANDGLKTDLANELHFSFRLKNDILEISSFEGMAEHWLKKTTNINYWNNIRFLGTKTGKSVYTLDLINHESYFNELLDNDIISKLLVAIEKRRELTSRTIQIFEGDENLISKDNNTIDYDMTSYYDKKVLKHIFSNIFNSIKHDKPASSHDHITDLISELSPYEIEKTASLLNNFSGKEIIKIFEEAKKIVLKGKFSQFLDFKEMIPLKNPILERNITLKERVTETRLKQSTTHDELRRLIITDIFSDYFKIPTLRDIFEFTNNEIHNQLSRLVFLGPLRREPERYYFFSGNIPSTVGKNGDKTPETLFYLKEIQELVNNELNDMGLNYKIRVTPISKEIGDIFSVRLEDQIINTEISLADVGFGISQILPIIVQSYLSANNIICIEQPEIHIHPRLQAELAQLFYKRIREKSSLQYIIETHSEHIILRFQKLIRKRQLNPSDISVLYLMRGEEGINCKELKMNQNGDFIDSWPEGFFEEAFRERFG